MDHSGCPETSVATCQERSVTSQKSEDLDKLICMFSRKTNVEATESFNVPVK